MSTKLFDDVIGPVPPDLARQMLRLIEAERNKNLDRGDSRAEADRYALCWVIGALQAYAGDET